MNIEQIENIARVCHEANRAFCETLGDSSQLPWAGAPDWQRESARSGVVHAMTEGATPGDAHRNWLRDKQADGWEYGPVKCATAKTHPCIVPFEKLPPDQQLKDVLFIAVVKALAVK